MRRLPCLLAMLAACGSDPGAEPDAAPTADAPEPDAPPAGTLTAYETCIAAGGAATAKFTTSNLHGPITSLVVAGGASVVILSSEDTSVKQWTISGSGGQSYQTPFDTNVGTLVPQLAATEAMDVMGVDVAGRLHRWTLADVSSEELVDTGAGVLRVLATNGNGSKAVIGTSSTVRLVDLMGTSPVVGAPVMTDLTEVTAVAITNGGLVVTAGANGPNPLIEVRRADSPELVSGSWSTNTITGKVRALAVTSDGALLVAVGDGFVATFDPTNFALPTTLTEQAGHVAVGVALLRGRANFVTAGAEGTLKTWDVATGAEVKSLAIPTPIGIGADRNGTFLYTAGPDGNLHGYSCQM